MARSKATLQSQRVSVRPARSRYVVCLFVRLFGCLFGWLVVYLVACLFVWCANACLSMLWRQICNLFAHPLALMRVVAPDDDWLERAEDLEPGARLLG